MYTSLIVSKDLRRILRAAIEITVDYDYEEPRSPFVLLALYQDGTADASKVLRDYFSLEGLRYALLNRWGMTREGPTVNYRRYLDSADFEPILKVAEEYAISVGSKILGPAHVAMALVIDTQMKNTISLAGLKERAEYDDMTHELDKLLKAEPDSRIYRHREQGRNGQNKRDFSGNRPGHNNGRPQGNQQQNSGGSNSGNRNPGQVSSNRQDIQAKGQAMPPSNNGKPVAVKLRERRPRAKDPNSMLAKFSIDLTDRAQKEKLDPVIGRDREINRTIEILGRKTKNNPILIGHEGVGKTAIAEGVAQRIVAGNVPDRLRDKRVFQIQMGELVAGTTYRGDFENRLKEIVQEATKHGDILFIDEVHTIIGAGQVSGGSLDASNFLKPALARGQLSVMAATTFDEFKTAFRKDKALRRRFQPVTVDPPSVAEAIVILKGLRASYEDFHGVTISEAAIEAAVNLSHRYVNERFLPDKAIDLMDEACSALASRQAMQAHAAELKAIEDSAANADTPAFTEEQKPALTVDDIAKVVSDWTGIPVSSMKDGEREKLLNLEERLRKHVIGQDRALETVADAVRCARAGLTDANRPVGAFMFLGRTGIGKTEVARALQRVLFDNDDLLRFDMSEYMEKNSVARLIGAPPGYVGYEDGGTLTEAVRRKPYRVVLFDEIEKAHPDVFNIFLQLLDDGRLTDGQGNTVDFRNCLIVLSTNCGVAQMKKRDIGFTQNGGGTREEGIPDRIMEEVERTFRPEFLNRLDEIILFSTLKRSDLRQIVDIQLSNLRKLLADRKITLELSDEAKDYLAKAGWSEDYGARPLKRVINKLVRKPLSLALLAQTVVDESRVEVTVVDGKLFFPGLNAANGPKDQEADRADSQKVPA